MDVDDSSEPVLVHPPKLMGGGRKREPLVQGPFLFQPAPRELEEEEVEGGEDVEEIGIRATDIFLVDGKSSSTGEEMEGEEKKAKGEVGVVGIVFADGRVDLCLEVEKLEALWVGRQETTQSNPILAVYETIDLGLLSQATSSSPSPSSSDSRSRSPSPPSLKTVLARSSPSFFLDPLYDDTVYISHAFGVHCLSMRNWIDGLRTALGGGNKGDEDGSLALGEFFERAVGTEVVRVVDTVSETDRTSAPISSIAIISDVYLSYSFLALTSSLQLVALPLSLRIASPPSSSLSASSNTPPPPSTSVKSTSSTGSKPAYTSLLSTQPFTLPQILSQPSTSLPVKPLFAAPSSSTTTGPLSTITPSTLRTLGKSIQSLRSTLHDILSASSTVQARLDLQLLELSRQLQKTTKIETLLSPSPVNSSSSTEPSPSTTTKSPAALKNRVDSVVRSQEVLIARVDKVLQKLMDQHQPVLSDYEKEWFAELGRMKGEVGVSTLDGQETERSSGSTTDGLGLKSRTAMVRFSSRSFFPLLSTRFFSSSFSPLDNRIADLPCPLASFPFPFQLESHLALLRPKLLVMSQKLADAQALKNSQQQKKTAALGRLQLRQLEKQLADESVSLRLSPLTSRSCTCFRN
jgi:nucleoporin NUP82